MMIPVDDNDSFRGLCVGREKPITYQPAPDTDTQRERIARAMWETASASRTDAAPWDTAADYVHGFYRHLADAALAVVRDDDTNLRARIEALAESWELLGRDIRTTASSHAVAAEALRAALGESK